MKSAIANLIGMVVLASFASAASASVHNIDLSTLGGTATSVSGPCYCTQSAFVSPVLQLQPGTYDLGHVRDYWVQSGGTPDAGEGQDNLYVLFGTQVRFGDSNNPPGGVYYVYPDYALCGQNDAGCNASFVGAYQDTNLTFQVTADADELQVTFIGNYVYTPPAVPEPAAPLMISLGLLFMAGTSKRRAKR